MNLKNVREQKGLTQLQLANTINVDRTLISKIESGVSAPSVDTAKKIANALGFEWTRFFDDSNALETKQERG